MTPHPTVEEAQAIISTLAASLFGTYSEFLSPAGPLSSEELGSAEGPDYEARYKALIEHIPGVIFVAPLQRGSGEAYVSSQIKTILGFTQEEWLEDPLRWYAQVHPEDQPRWSLEAASLFSSGKPLSSCYRVISRDGRVVWFQCEARMVHTGEGKPSFIHGVGFDVSELKEAEVSLKRAKDELEVRVQERTHALALSNAQLTLEVTEHKRTELLLIAAKEWAENSARVKDQFMANMSHEIRTPMNGVLGLTGLLLETSLTADQRRYLSMVQSSAESLLSVINQVLDFSKLESGKAQLDIARFSLGHCIETLIDDLQIQAVQKGLMLQYRIAAGIPRFLLGDTGRLRQVLTNLIANAIKFTRKGRVDLEITRAPVVDGAEGQSDCRLQFAIHDTGIGIPASALESIFQPFVQADGSMTREFEGTGLGLAISKDLVTMMKGQISVASVEGSGSTFSFSAAFGIALEEAAPANPRQGPLRVLVAVDNLVDRIVVTGVLEGCGHHVTTAANGREVLDAHRASAFDVILMDVQIPLLDGFETTRALRETEALHGSARVPVIGLSAQGAEKDRSQCTEAGMSGYLSKPVHGRELISLIEELIGRVDRKKAGVGENAGQG